LEIIFFPFSFPLLLSIMSDAMDVTESEAERSVLASLKSVAEDIIKISLKCQVGALQIQPGGKALTKEQVPFFLSFFLSFFQKISTLRTLTNFLFFFSLRNCLNGLSTSRG